MIQTPLSPVLNNVVSTLITIAYVKFALEVGSYVRVKYGVTELSRKFVHLCACSFVVFWPLYDAGHWGWRLNVTVPAVMSLRLIYKVGRFFLGGIRGAILKDPEDEDVRSMSRTSSPSELLFGPLQMTLIMCRIGLTRFMTEIGVVVMASLVGDGVAAMVGIEYGKRAYRMPLVGGDKSVEGTIGCALGTMGAILFFSYMCGVEVTGGYRMLVAYGIVSAIVEATALRNFDNLLLALAMEMAVKHHAKLGPS
ncbi:hypothetical protein ACHAW5_006379 [Stephanodiscus triporus]|uniref:Dolichol kinase n=1 Tax=Stephanodiscus triporus TaxID=2934178 RepID=A0ABD3QTW3_9STRA